MKSAGPFIIATVLLLAAVAPAQDAVPAAADKPYATIVARNMFGLVPIPPPDPNAGMPPEEPPPKITPNGIMTIFGHVQALFKVALKGKAGQPAKDQAYVLSEGERQDEIEVVKINEADRVITFNNHGKIQELPLVVAAASTAPGGGAGPGGAAGAGNPALAGGRQGMASPTDRSALLRGRPLGKGAMPGSPDAGNNPAALNPANPNSIGAEVNERGIYQPRVDPNPMTPEESAVLIETQRGLYQDQGNPIANLLPPPPPGRGAQAAQKFNALVNGPNPSP